MLYPFGEIGQWMIIGVRRNGRIMVVDVGFIVLTNVTSGSDDAVDRRGFIREGKDSTLVICVVSFEVDFLVRGESWWSIVFIAVHKFVDV